MYIWLIWFSWHPSKRPSQETMIKDSFHELSLGIQGSMNLQGPISLERLQGDGLLLPSLSTEMCNTTSRRYGVASIVLDCWYSCTCVEEVSQGYFCFVFLCCFCWFCCSSCVCVTELVNTAAVLSTFVYYHNIFCNQCYHLEISLFICFMCFQTQMNKNFAKQIKNCKSRRYHTIIRTISFRRTKIEKGIWV